ncbi:MAG: PilZ domain-containing protein [Planctomycetota bacterium]
MGKASTERRRHKRHEAAYPVTVFDASGKVLARTRTVNISRGGLLLRAPREVAPAPKDTVEVDLSAPGSDARVAEFFCQAQVVRHQPIDSPGHVGVALEFTHPLPLRLGD